MADTILNLKEAFLVAQTRALSASVTPSADWSDDSHTALDGDLHSGAVDRVMIKGKAAAPIDSKGDLHLAVFSSHRLHSPAVQNAVKSHNRQCYPSSAISVVAQQVYDIYWNSTEPRSDSGDLAEDAIGLNVDLSDDAVIASLPDTWPTEDKSALSQLVVAHKRRSALETFDSESRYARLRERLTALAAKRRELKGKIASARALSQAISPLRDPAGNVQPHLVTKDGELSQELERMKILMARARGRLEQGALPVFQDNETLSADAGGLEESSNNKVASILAKRPVVRTATRKA